MPGSSSQGYGTGVVMTGQEYSQIDDIIFQFTKIEREVNYPDFKDLLYGTNAVNIDPKTQKQTILRQYLRSAIQAEFAAVYRTSPGVEKVFLPPVLTALAYNYNTSNGDGLSTETGTGFSEGTYGSLTLSLKGTAEGSCAASVEVAPTIDDIWAHNVPVTYHDMFFVGGFTLTDVINRLAAAAPFPTITVNPWPVFKPQTHAIALFGQQTNNSATCNVQQHVSFSNGSSTNFTETTGAGNGYSFRTAVNSKIIVLPSCLHGAITIGTASETVSCAASTSASMSSGSNWDALSNSEDAPTGFATAAIYPTSLAATSPAAVPTTGIFLKDVIAENYKFGVQRCRAVTIDFSYFA